MVRALRLEYSGALYHVTARGDRREDIYEDDIDRFVFLELFKEVCERFNWDCHAYCLMSNHYHLLIETPDGNLSKGMRQLNGVYAQSYNRRHGKVGHVFQGRYTAILVEKESYLLELSRYVVLNPVRARMVEAASDWPWSSYRQTVSETQTYDFLNTSWLLSHFHSDRSIAIEGYKKFVDAGVNKSSPLNDTKHQLFLGGDAFIERGFSLIDAEADLSEVVRIQKKRPPKPIEVYESNSTSRNEAIRLAYEGGGYTMKEIGDYFGISYSMVSRIVNNSKFKT